MFNNIDKTLKNCGQTLFAIDIFVGVIYIFCLLVNAEPLNVMSIMIFGLIFGGLISSLILYGVGAIISFLRAIYNNKISAGENSPEFICTNMFFVTNYGKKCNEMYLTGSQLKLIKDIGYVEVDKNKYKIDEVILLWNTESKNLCATINTINIEDLI